VSKHLVSIVYNTCVYVEKFRLPLIMALKGAGYDVVVIAPTDDATQRLTQLGIMHRSINISQYGMNPLAELNSIREVRNILKELRPIASLHYTVKPNTFGSLAAHLAGVPVLNNIAGAGRAFSGGNPAIRALVILLYRFGLGRSHTVFFQNDDDMVVFLENGLVRAEQCVRIPGSGVDLNRFKATPPIEGNVRFLFVGRLLKEKGVTEFLNAANALISETSNSKGFQFDLVGEWEDDRRFISKADLHRLTEAPNITYHGAVPPQRIDAMIRSSSCLVLPSYYGEGVPRVLLEACASGRPIITTDNVGCREVVEAGKNGWMVKPRDTGDLLDAMRACSTAGHEKLAELGRAARRTAEKRFDEQTVIRAYFQRLAMVKQD
jgi:glycosyltransferase involved in cell wall biosynthesis